MHENLKANYGWLTKGLEATYPEPDLKAKLMLPHRIDFVTFLSLNSLSVRGFLRPSITC
jgi:hypothetical protein